MPRPNFDEMISSKNELGLILKYIRENIKTKLAERTIYFYEHEIYEVERVYANVIYAYEQYSSWGYEMWWDKDDELLKELQDIIQKRQKISINKTFGEKQNE